MKTPVRYSPEIAMEICERMATGQSLRSICKGGGMPDESTVRGWARDDVEGFAPQYAWAREMQAHSLVEEMLEIADDGTNDWMEREGQAVVNQEHVARSKIRLDTRKFLASKILPKVYGEKLEIDATTRQAVVSAEPTGEEWQDKHGRRS